MTDRPTDRLNFSWRRQVPVIRQTEAAECGLASLAMLVNALGLRIDLATLRRRHGTAATGATLAQIKQIAESMGFLCRPLQLDMDHLGKLRVPCLLHWNLNHFVVLVSTTRRHAIIHDPAHGKRRISLEEVSRCFTGIAMEVAAPPAFAPSDQRERTTLQDVTGTIRGWKAALAQVAVLALGLQLFTILGPLYLQWVVDGALVSADHELLTLLGLGFLVVTIARAAIGAARSWMIAWLSAKISAQWIVNVFAHLLTLPLDWFSKRHVGAIISRFNSLDFIQRTLTNQFVGTLLDGVMSLAMLVIMAVYSWKLFGIVALVFAAYAAFRWMAFRILERASESHIIALAKQQSDLLESIRGIAALKIGGRLGIRNARYANAVVETVNRDVRVQQMTVTFAAINQLLFGCGRIAVIWLGALAVMNNELTAGMLIAFAAYADQFAQSGASLIDNLAQIALLRMHKDRLKDITLERPESIGEAQGLHQIESSDLELHSVSFRYSDHEPWILRNVSLRIEAGESVAIIGSSGAGKSTLIKLVLGLLRPTEGTITMGGVDISFLGDAAYRAMIAAVMQDDQLFSGTVSENIAFFDDHADLGRVHEAARVAGIHQDIAAMPMGYETHVGDMGSLFSGGQRQRIILARAIYREPKVMVLDEATSSLDLQREEQVNAGIRALKITRLIVAHRRETFATADRIMLLGNRSENYCLVDVTAHLRPAPKVGEAA